MVSVSDFLQFIRGNMGIEVADLPDDSIAIQYAFNRSLNTVSHMLEHADPFGYCDAVINLAAHFLVMTSPGTYFSNLRDSLKLNQFTAGVLKSSSDNTTENDFEISEGLKNLSTMDLQCLKTIWGRTYLDYAQQIGSIWGRS
jgi:hypothetical protein